MVRRRYYRKDIPLSSQTLNKEQVKRDLASEGQLGGGGSTLESVSVDPRLLAVEATYRGYDAERMKSEFDELLNANLIGPIPFYGLTPDNSYRQTPEDAYYVPESGHTQPADPRFGTSDGVWQVVGRMRRKGTPKSHWRSVKTNPTTVTNPFGSGTTAYIGVDSEATKIQWFNEETEAREAATLVATRNAEYGDVEVYDADASSYSTPTLIFDLAMAREGRVDVKIWDTRGNATPTETVNSETVLAWQRVFDADHFFEGDAVLDNGLARLTFDEANNTLSAEEWNNGTGSWDSVALGATGAAPNWQLRDLDITQVWTNRVEAQVDWENTSTGALHRIDMSLKRGYNWPLWMRPANGSATPAGLVTKLTPVAATSDNDPQESGGVVSRQLARE